MAEKKKLSIISMSGDFDKVIAVFTLASGAAAVGYEVNIFFTFWGLNSIKKVTGRSFIGSGFMARFFNFLLGGRKSLPLSRLNFGGLSPILTTGMMKGKNVAGSVVLNEVPPHSTVAGIPAWVVGKPKFAQPGKQMDHCVEFDFCI